jgi:hypothetical protein
VAAVHVGGGRPVEKAARRAGPVATTVTSDRHVHAVALKSFAGWASGRCKLAGTIEVGLSPVKGLLQLFKYSKRFQILKLPKYKSVSYRCPKISKLGMVVDKFK